MGIGGGSYGGYMTNWVIGQTNRFAAAVSMRSISNLVSEYAQHDIVLWGALELGPPPWPDLDELWRRSPIRYVQNMQTPLLLSCGEMDLRCAISQSEELFGAMRFLGKTVEMVRFPEESHDLSRSGRPDRRVERLNRIASWYERFLGTHSVEKAAEAETQVLPVQHAEAEKPVAAVAQTAVLETMRVSQEPQSDEFTPTTVLETLPTDTEAPPVEPEPEPVSEPPVPEPVAEVAPFEAEPAAEAAAPAEPSAEAEAPISGILPVFPEPEPVYAEPVAEAPPQASAEAPPEPPPVEPEPAVIEAASSEAEAVEEAPEPEPMAEAQEPEPVEEAPEPEPVAAAQEPEPMAEAPEPEPEPSAPSVTSTMLRWPTASSIPGLQDNGEQTDSGEPATSIIPAWQPADIPAESKRTVSLSAMPPEAIAAGESFAAKLSFESGPFAGRIVALPSQMVTVGRAPDNDVVVSDPATSGRHGRIEVRAGVFWISDLGSTNGTLVNGEPVIEKQLSDGDLIAIGQNTMRFTIE